MATPYAKQTWVDGSAGGTPISAARLGVIEQGIEDSQFPVPGYVRVEDDFFFGGTSDGGIGLGWKVVNNSQGSSTSEPSSTDHIGVHRISASNTTNNIYGICSDPADGTIMAPQLDRLIWIFSPNTTGSTNIRAGFCQDPTVASCGTNGAWWDFTPGSNANYRTITRGSSTNTTNNTTVVPVIDTYVKTEIRRLGNGNYEFYMNNTLKFTHSTNLPSASVPLVFFCVVETTTTASKQVNIDYFGFMSVALGNRYT